MSQPGYDELARLLYEMNGQQWYGRDLGDWDDPDSRIGRNEYERGRWLRQAERVANSHSLTVDAVQKDSQP